MKKTIIILAHPNMEASVANKALIQGIQDLEHVTMRDLYQIYGGDMRSIDVKAEQALLLEHDRIVFQFPWYWYSSPAMLKEYMDTVLSYGFAYGSTGDKLNGKTFKIAVTVGAPDYAYQAGGWNLKSMNELLSPYQAMAHLTGMTYTRPFRLHGTAAISDEELSTYTAEYRKILEDQDWDNGLQKYIRGMSEDTVKAK
jgi:glutathione-regulated potassium-efflux system ancillary protein KefG